MSTVYSINNLHLSDNALYVLLFVFGAVAFISICLMLRWLLGVRKLYQRPKVFLELIPSARAVKSPFATEQLFNVIHGINSTLSLLDRILGNNKLISFEIVSSKEQGIRFIACLDASDQALVERNLIAYVPDVRITVLDQDPCRVTAKMPVRLLSFKQAGHFAYPLRSHTSTSEHDPIAYLTATMTQLKASEWMAFQLVLSPAPHQITAGLRKRVHSNGRLEDQLKRNRSATYVLRALRWIVVLPIRLLMLLLSGWLFGYEPSKSKVSVDIKNLSQSEQAVLNSVDQKLRQPLFYASIRGLIVSVSKQTAKERSKGLRTAMTSYRVPKLQALSARSLLFGRLSVRFRMFLFRNRLPEMIRSSAALLSTSEVAAIYHFPDNGSARTENIVKSLSRSLPAPVSLKSGARLDILLGVNVYHNKSTPIGLSEAERERHVYIVGGTGNGKTTMLLGSIIQDMKNGKGIAVIDPHGDLAESVLRHVPESRLNDVVYFNPDDLDYPLGLNLLEVPDGVSGSELLRERDIVTESVISIFRKLFSDDDSGGHRVEYILRNAIQTAMTLPKSTIFTVYNLLNDPTYQKTVVRGLEDKNLRNFWWHELGRAGDYQRVKMAAGVTAKIGRFLFSASARQILEQPHSTLDFDDILKSGKILICNVSKGRLGEDTATLFGTTILAKLQIATLRRARMPEDQRRPFYVYVDEFQNFATTSFVQMLSESRKYKLFLTMAEQSTSQQAEQRMVQIILANVGTLVCFRTGNPADELLLLPSFQPFIEPGELTNLPAYNFYVRLASLRSQEPLSGETQLLEDKGSERMMQQVIASSREQYVIPKEAGSNNSENNKQPKPERPIVAYPVRAADQH